MAKTIKFNLICDGKPVRTLEDLQNNFSIEDVISYFNNKLLQRWLKVRGYNQELDKIEALQAVDEMSLIKKLIEIFEVDMDMASVEEKTYILRYKWEHETLLDEYKKMNFKQAAIIDAYHSGYDQLIEDIYTNFNDISRIKAVIAEINKRYEILYELNYRTLFYEFFKKAPLAIFVMIMNSKMRDKYLPISIKKEDGSYEPDIIENTDKKDMYETVRALIVNRRRLHDVLGENLKVFSGETDGYWKDVEAPNKKYMILKMENGNYVRSAGKKGEELASGHVYEKFVILDGIDYKSNNASHVLFYMEV